MRKEITFLAFTILLLYALDQAFSKDSNARFIDKMDPSVRPAVRSFLKEIENMGYTPVIRDSTRTSEMQAFYKKMDPRNAAPGTSSHERGIAIDMDVYKGDKVLSKKTPRSAWLSSGVPALAKEYGMKWGGNFKNYADNNHFYF